MPTNKSFEQVRQLLTTTSRGEVQSTIQNCVTVLQNDPLFAGGIRLNLLTERVDVTKAMAGAARLRPHRHRLPVHPAPDGAIRPHLR